MIWNYLSDGGYLHPLFASWFSNTYVTVYWAIWVINALCLVLVPLAVSHVLRDREEGTPNLDSRVRVIRIHIYTLLRLVKSSKKTSFFRIVITFGVLLSSLGYGLYYIQIIADPHLLTTGLIQELNAEDVRLLIDFLYRFAFLGGFLILISTAVSFGFFTSILSDHDV